MFCAKKQGSLGEEQKLTVMRSVSGKLAETQRNTQFISRLHSGFLPLKSAAMDVSSLLLLGTILWKTFPKLDCAARSARARHLVSAARLAKLNHPPDWHKSEVCLLQRSSQSRRELHIFEFLNSKQRVGCFLHCLAMTVASVRDGSLGHPQCGWCKSGSGSNTPCLMYHRNTRLGKTGVAPCFDLWRNWMKMRHGWLPYESATIPFCNRWILLVSHQAFVGFV